MRKYGLGAALPMALGLCLAGAIGTPAVAATPPAAEQSPVGGTNAHPHFVMTGSGCVDIDQVRFEPGARGLHRGAQESGPSQGPWHGACPNP
ncbi:hypothetical protein [Pseudarthrobacter sp. NS4]|uniref:hypothetical protein n=1 Tax=Pseudarthrobacter sp. NS4 TaxID=2973976 RepID=UPI00216339BD|nr:hypothetical protein [Pseudarthrobacter sp. NS4]